MAKKSPGMEVPQIERYTKPQNDFVQKIVAQFNWHDKQGAKLNKRGMTLRITLGSISALTVLATSLTNLPDSWKLAACAVLATLGMIGSTFDLVKGDLKLGAEYRDIAEELRLIMIEFLDDEEKKFNDFKLESLNALKKHRKAYIGLKTQINEVSERLVKDPTEDKA